MSEVWEWDEDAAFAQACGYFECIGDGAPEAWAMLNGVASAVLDQFGVDVAAALDSQDRAALDAAFDRFRRDFAEVWRQRLVVSIR